MDLNEKELFHAQNHLWNHLYCFINSMSLKCAVQLGISDVIHNHGQPITLSEMATKLAIPTAKTDSLFRLMRLLVHSGAFAIEKVGEGDEEGYVLTHSSRLLLKDNVTTISPMFQLVLDPMSMSHWHFFSEWFKGDGLTAFETAHKKTLWEYAGQDTELNHTFNEAMEGDTRLVKDIIVTKCEGVFEGFRSLVDVAGGTGTLAKAIAESFPSLKCVVLDLPHVVAGLEGNENLTYIAGDMFEFIPPADVVLLKWILHDWNDEQCIKILKGCKKAISHRDKGRNSGKVILIEMVLGDRKEDHKSTETQLFYDMQMMTLFGGKERTEKEWETVFLESGFTHYKITPIFGLRSLIEVYP